ncbi:MAG: SAM-dependent methyltransferase [Solobacterium sp.]|nr:SAM-dependent methyltransferase [Solobacterium sp.]
MSQRLEAIASLVQAGTVPADIGTDHAYVPVMLVKQGICTKAYACDVAKGPLESAKHTITSEGLEGQVIPVLSDGFSSVPEDADAAVITGMGCTTAIKILEEGMDRLSAMKQIVLSVNNHTDDMRRWISDHGFTILDEAFVSEAGHNYEIEVFCTASHTQYSEEEIVLGPVLKEKGDAEYIRYISSCADTMTKLLAFPSAETEKRRQKKSIYDAYLQKVKETV